MTDMGEQNDPVDTKWTSWRSWSVMSGRQAFFAIWLLR